MSPFSFCMAIIIILHFHVSSVNSCRDDERSYLFDFKSGLKDSSGRLSSWQNFNCCQWEGVICDYHSDHVVSLDLKSSKSDLRLSRNIRPSLFNLQHLQYLDLRLNDFYPTATPTAIFRFESGSLRRTIREKEFTWLYSRF
ncbi:hypothetical protein SUGI_0874150 [Cryptomeria japonica]|nr:hypothetical protein SUGI_0874150 [Cryptomeria japonica]